MRVIVNKKSIELWRQITRAKFWGCVILTTKDLRTIFSYYHRGVTILRLRSIIDELAGKLPVGETETILEELKDL